MKRFLPIIGLLLMMVYILAGCGPKTAENVVNDLSKNVTKISGYKTRGTMVFQTGKTPQEYDVEVWYQKPGFYRISLSSKQQNVTQIILRNNEGVFVLTPHLNKSFRFQSNWPQNQPQVYLYESLIKDIANDTARKYETNNGQYLFTVKANYPNRTLTTQKVTFDKDLKPVRVELIDSNMNSMVMLNFTQFEFNPTFDKDSFNKDRNMQSAVFDSIPTFATVQKQIEEEKLTAVRPTYLPKGDKLLSVRSAQGEDGTQIVLQYSGPQPFKLIENKPRATEVSLPVGDPVDLGHTIGIMTHDSSNKQTLIWTYNGVEYNLSGSMAADEMIQIAKSVYKPAQN